MRVMLLFFYFKTHIGWFYLKKYVPRTRTLILIEPYFASKSASHDVTLIVCHFHQPMEGTKFLFAHTV